MTYLFGDSTESGLELNYIEFLRSVLDLAIEVLLAEHRAQSLSHSGDDKKRAAEAELAELREISDAVGRALEGAPGGPRSMAQRCVAAIRNGASDALKNAAAAVRAQLAEHLAGLATQTNRERTVAARALEIFLVHNELAGSSRQLDLVLDPGGAVYAASLRGRAAIGLDWRLALEIPPGHVFAQPFKLERLGMPLEIRVPETGGWMRKGVRMKSQRLGTKYLLELSNGAQQTTLKLRDAPYEDEAGFNVLVGNTHTPIRLVRVAKGGEHSPPFEPLDEDVPTLLELSGHLQRELAGLTGQRKSLLEARIDGKPIDEQEGASLAVRRLIATLVPVVQDIARHSLAPDELVLKRVLADGRREEIFVAKADLVAKLEAVPASLRAIFQPLGLSQPHGGAGANAGTVSGPTAATVMLGPEAQTYDRPVYERDDSIGGASEGLVETTTIEIAGDLVTSAPMPQRALDGRGESSREARESSREARESSREARESSREARESSRSERARSSVHLMPRAVPPPAQSAAAERAALPRPEVDEVARLPLSEDDDVTMVATSPPPPPQPRAPTATAAPIPAVKNGQDSVEVHVPGDGDRDRNRN